MRASRLVRIPVLAFVLAVAGMAACASGSSGATAAGAASSGPREGSLSIEAALQRKASGLIVTRTADGWIALQPRASTSHDEEGTRPLFILNGVPFRPGPGGALVGIDPGEIETVKLLRPAESGLYGIDGMNGVIVITTKRPGSSTSRTPPAR